MNASNAVSFINRGLIDMHAVRVLGVSVKEGDNPIGFFGTGLKYAIAICLRLGCTVTIYRGFDKYEFGTAEIKVRGAGFRLVTLNGAELGFTTELGKTWEAWQAFRELYCNVLDEGGSVHDGEVDAAEEHTLVVVSGAPIHKAYIERDNIVLQGNPQWVTQQAQVFARVSGFAYYRGVRVAQLQQPAALTYNVTQALDLTEDRTIKNIYAYHGAVRDAVLHSNDASFIRAFLKATTGSYESGLDLDNTWSTPGELFLSMVDELGFRECTNNSAFKVFKKHRRSVLQPDPTPLNKVEEIQIGRARRFCEFMGYKVAEYDIVITADLEESTLGRAYEGRIYINRSAFARGTKIVAGTLIEEYIHLRHKLADESRGLQDHLLNALVSMGELAMGEPV